MVKKVTSVDKKVVSNKVEPKKVASKRASKADKKSYLITSGLVHALEGALSGNQLSLLWDLLLLIELNESDGCEITEEMKRSVENKLIEMEKVASTLMGNGDDCDCEHCSCENQPDGRFKKIKVCDGDNCSCENQPDGRFKKVSKASKQN